MISLLLALSLTVNPVYLQDPKRPTKSLFATGLDGGPALQVTCDNCSSSGSAPGGGLTNTELRATPVPVSGTLACTGPLTDTQLRATPVPVSGSLTCSVASTTITGRVTVDPYNAYDGGIQQVAGRLTCDVFAASDGGVQQVAGRLTADTFDLYDGGWQNAWCYFQADAGAVTAFQGGTWSVSRHIVDTFDAYDGGGRYVWTFNLNDGGYQNIFLQFDGGAVTAVNRSVAFGSSPAAVAATSLAQPIADLEGRQYVNIAHPRPFNCRFASATTATLLELTGCAAVASNSYWITDITICGGTATAATVPALIQSGTGTNCSVATATWYTCFHAAAGCCIATLVTPIKLTVAHALCMIDATVGTKSANIGGFIAP